MFIASQIWINRFSTGQSKIAKVAIIPFNEIRIDFAAIGQALKKNASLIRFL